MKTGIKVKIVGLQSEEGKSLNGLEGVIDHNSKKLDRYAISLPGMSDLKMIKEKNLEPIDPSSQPSDQVFSGEDDMLEHLKRMGMPPEMLKNLTPSQKKTMLDMTQQQDILERAKNAAGVDSLEEKELKDVDGRYGWRDASDYVHIEVKGCDETTSCKIENASISISSGKKEILKGSLFQTIDAAQSNWEVSKDGKLTVTLKKVGRMRWLMVTRQ
jgi:hypothetical protein